MDDGDDRSLAVSLSGKDLLTRENDSRGSARRPLHFNTRAPIPGLSELREALAAKLRDYNRINVSGTDGVLVTNGGVNALFVILGSILGPGDSIRLPDSGWSNFTMMARTFGADITYYRLHAGNGYLPDPDVLRSLIDHTTRAVIFNSPSNLVGAGHVVDVRVAAVAHHRPMRRPPTARFISGLPSSRTTPVEPGACFD